MEVTGWNSAGNIYFDFEFSLIFSLLTVRQSSSIEIYFSQLNDFDKSRGFFGSHEPRAQVSYCHSASSVGLSYFQLLLQNRLMDFDETWLG